MKHVQAGPRKVPCMITHGVVHVAVSTRARTTVCRFATAGGRRALEMGQMRRCKIVGTSLFDLEANLVD